MILSNMDTAAEQAGTVLDDSLDHISDHLEIKSVVGICDPSKGELTGLELIVTLGPGSGGINLSSLTIELVLSDAHMFLVQGDQGFKAEKLLSGGNSNSSNIIARGDMFLVRFALPHGADGNDIIRLVLLPSTGFATTMSMIVPDTTTSTYISIR